MDRPGGTESAGSADWRFQESERACAEKLVNSFLCRLLNATRASERRQRDVSVALKKEDAHKLIDVLPADATWDDLMHEIYVREAIERGLADSRNGRTKDV